MNFIPYGKQWIGDDDVKSIADAMHDDFLTTGPKVKEFEEAVAKYCGAEFGVAVCNGTAALHIASLALLEKGDKVLTTPNSFLATSNAIIYAGAKPVFVDIAEDGNIDLELCEKALEEDADIKAIYPVHFSGNPVDQGKLKALRERFGVKILEDCAHSIGAENAGVKAGVKAGSCAHSDASIFSFHPVKHMTTGEGGMVTTNDKALYERMLTLRNHGMVRDGLKNTEMAFDAKGELNPWYYEMHEVGYNYRITDFQCALGLNQLSKLDAFIERRKVLAQAYDKAFAECEHVKPLYAFDGCSSYHLYVLLIDFAGVGVEKSEFFAKMREKHIGLQLHYIPINKQPFYKDMGHGNEMTPVMDKYYERAVSIPLYPKMSDEEQAYVVESIFEILGK